MSPEQKSIALKLRSEGRNFTQIKNQLGLPYSAVWNLFHPKPEKPPPPPPPKKVILPTPIYHSSSVPKRKIGFDPSFYRNQTPPTKTQMQATLRTAVLNTIGRRP